MLFVAYLQNIHLCYSGERHHFAMPLSLVISTVYGIYWTTKPIQTNLTRYVASNEALTLYRFRYFYYVQHGVILKVKTLRNAMQQLSGPENEHRFHYFALIIIWIYCRSGKLLQFAINQILALKWLPQVSGYQPSLFSGWNAGVLPVTAVSALSQVLQISTSAGCTAGCT